VVVAGQVAAEQEVAGQVAVPGSVVAVCSLTVHNTHLLPGEASESD
jgi:hypothetical protein